MIWLQPELTRINDTNTNSSISESSFNQQVANQADVQDYSTRNFEQSLFNAQMNAQLQRNNFGEILMHEGKTNVIFIFVIFCIPCLSSHSPSIISSKKLYFHQTLLQCVAICRKSLNRKVNLEIWLFYFVYWSVSSW